MAINVDDMTFGVEIETTIPANSCTDIGGHGRGRQVSWLPAGWLADADPSISAGLGERACEFVSPVFKGRDGLRQMIAAIREIVAHGAKVNSSCGLHIHVGFNKSNEAMLRKLVAMVANFEKAIYAQTGTRSRETGAWCRSIARNGSLDNAMRNRGNTRYMILNTITNKPTVEFRPFAATLNVTKIVGHVLTVVALVEKTLNGSRTAQFIAKTPKPSSPIARSGEGQTALCRMFYALGWTKGREKHVYGDLLGADMPTLKEIKRELMRLAKKYDQRGA